VVKLAAWCRPTPVEKSEATNILRELARRHSITFFSFYAAHDRDLHPELKDVFEHVVCVPLQLPAPKSVTEMRATAFVCSLHNPTASQSIVYPRCGADCERCSSRKVMTSSSVIF